MRRLPLLGLLAALVLSLVPTAAPSEAGTGSATLLRSVTVSRTTVDLSKGGTTVVVTAHARDPKGVKGFYAYFDRPGVRDLIVEGMNGGRRIHGTRYDGIWRAKVHLPSFMPAGSWKLTAFIKDRTGTARAMHRERGLRVINPHGDRTAPKVAELITPADGASTAVGSTLAVSLHLRDDVSGIASADVCASYDHVPSTPLNCTGAVRVSGSQTDGKWMAWVSGFTQPGTWRLSVQLYDHAHRYAFYVADPCGDLCQSPATFPIPDARGTFTVTP